MTERVRQVSRREFLRAAAAAAFALPLAACGVSTPEARIAAKETVQLVYQDWRTEWFPIMAQEMLARFNEEHPNIRVFYTPDPENKEEKMVSDMAAGTAPDLMSGCCEFFPAWADAGYLLDLRPHVEADRTELVIDDWSDAQYQALITSDGLQFGLPQYHGALALYYNKDLFDRADILYPTDSWDHDDYLAALHKLTLHEEDKVVQWGGMFNVSWDRIQMHVNGWGGHYANPDNPSECQMADKVSLEAMDWLRARIWDDKVMATSLDVQNMSLSRAFVEGKVAMIEDGSWSLKDILENVEFRFGIVPFPAGPAKRVTLATTDGFGIYAKTRNVDASWEFMKFLVSKEYGMAMAKAHLLQPARSSLLQSWIDLILEQYGEVAANANIGAFTDGQLKGYSVTAEIFPNMVGVGKVAKEAWDQVFTLGKAPVTEMANVCRQIEAIQKAQSDLMPDCNCGPAG